jgi:hypothetical protein
MVPITYLSCIEILLHYIFIALTFSFYMDAETDRKTGHALRLKQRILLAHRWDYVCGQLEQVWSSI